MRCDMFTMNMRLLKKPFQSLLGFPMRCDKHVSPMFRFWAQVSIPIGFSNALRHCNPRTAQRGQNKFQSLLGFPMRCDLSIYRIIKYYSVLFQSLLGFPMRCDLVLIKIRKGLLHCFNPYWVFQCAATVHWGGRLRRIYKFQSLLGFPMRCDLSLIDYIICIR